MSDRSDHPASSERAPAQGVALPPSGDGGAPAAEVVPEASGRARITLSGLLAGWRRRLAATALLVACLGALAAVLAWQRAEAIAQEAARRLQAADARAAQLDGQWRQAQDQLRELQGRSGVLESKLTEALGRQAQLESLYRTMAQDSLDAVLADVENALAIASQQLMVSGNIQGALVALADADARLARIRQPQAVGLRRLLQRDIERLKALPVVDLVGLAIRLDTVVGAIDQLPLLAQAAAPAVAAGTPPLASAGGFSLERLASTGRRGIDALLAELSQLFRVNRVDAPDALLLAPEQQYFVRQNLRLVLLSARLALLARLEPVFKADLDRAVGWLGTHFDQEQRAVANAISALRQLQGARIAPELPSLGDALAAVRSARTALENNP